MVKKLLVIAAIVMMVGCKGGGGDGVTFGGVQYAALPGDPSTPTTPTIPTDPTDPGAHMNPEPTTLMLFGMGLSGLVAAKFRKKKQ